MFDFGYAVRSQPENRQGRPHSGGGLRPATVVSPSVGGLLSVELQRRVPSQKRSVAGGQPVVRVSILRGAPLWISSVGGSLAEYPLTGLIFLAEYQNEQISRVTLFDRGRPRSELTFYFHQRWPGSKLAKSLATLWRCLVGRDRGRLTKHRSGRWWTLRCRVRGSVGSAASLDGLNLTLQGWVDELEKLNFDYPFVVVRGSTPVRTEWDLVLTDSVHGA